MKILFFIDSLRSGGKERRLAELLCYLKKYPGFDLSLVLTEDIISYTYVRDLKIPIHVIKRRIIKYDPSLLFRFYKIAKEFNPDIIHTWGMMTTGYAIPAKLMLKRALIANLVADAKKDCKELSLQNLFWKIDFKFADVILGNSDVGLRAYGLQNNKKASLIYNGVRLERFSGSTDVNKVKGDIGIETPYIAIMVASTSKYKDYDLLLDVANYMISRRTDITFLGVGDGDELERLSNRVRTENMKNIILTGKRSDIESLIAISDIGLLFTHSEVFLMPLLNIWVWESR
jgi:glycosyltransferase involved in cell wall biosynthesis